MRKMAILRILKRQVVIEYSLTGQKLEEPRKMAETLLVELIRAGYLANNKWPESAIDEVAAILDRYLQLRHYSLHEVARSGRFFQQKIRLVKNEMEVRTELINWLMGMAASEIEEKLNYSQSTEVIVGYMYQVLQDSLQLPADLPYDEDLSIQIYLAIYRNFLKLDDEDILNYQLLKYYFPIWQEINEVQCSGPVVFLPLLFR